MVGGTLALFLISLHEFQLNRQFYIQFEGHHLGALLKIPANWITRPDTLHKIRLVCVLFTFENNTGRTDGPTDGPADGHDLL